MPIDPSIPLSAHGIGPLVNPMEIVQQAQQLRLQRESAEALAEQRKAQAEQRAAQTAKLQREAERETMGNAGLDEFFSTYEPGKPIPTGAVGKMYRGFGPEKTSAIVKGLLDFHTADLTNADGVRKSMYTRIVGLKALPEDRRAAAYDAVSKDYVSKGVIKPEEVAPYSPEVLDRYEQQLMTPEQRANAAKPINAPPPGQSLLDPKTMKPVFTSPEKVTHSPALVEFQDAVAQGYKGTFEQYQTADANRKRPVTNVSGMGGMYAATDPKVIAEGIRNGTMPPRIADYGRAVQGAVATELGKSGYNLASALTDWNATQKHILTMNGAQQLRLTQAINSLPDMLDSVDRLASQWKGGSFPILNKANLALAKGGAYGKDVASIANQLDSQIADVTADLGVVYMGGNSPTDHGLGLAGKSLKGEWDEKVLHDMVKLAKANVTIRRNSVLNTGVAGASAGNQYAAPAPAAAAPVAAPAPAPAGMIHAKDPQGNIHQAKAGTPLPAGWTIVQGGG